MSLWDKTGYQKKVPWFLPICAPLEPSVALALPTLSDTPSRPHSFSQIRTGQTNAISYPSSYCLFFLCLFKVPPFSTTWACLRMGFYWGWGERKSLEPLSWKGGGLHSP